MGKFTEKFLIKVMNVKNGYVTPLFKLLSTNNCKSYASNSGRYMTHLH